jgi:poly-gamma-glutamate synthesis protein (capsule biosynthesis protein)
MLDVAKMTVDVSDLLTRADAVVVSMHAGVEYQTKPNAEQRRFAHAAIDAGAAVVVGTHPHVTQPTEHYKDGVIFYSLGNLVFDQFQRKETQHGLIAEVYFRGNRLERSSVILVDIVQTAPRVAQTWVP